VLALPPHEVLSQLQFYRTIIGIVKLMFLLSRRCPRVALSTSSVSAQTSPTSRVQRALLKHRHPTSGRKIASKCARHPTRQPRMVGRAIKLTMPMADMAPRADEPQVAGRSPPALRPSRIHHMSEGTPVRMSDVCPVEWARDRGRLARSRACGAEPWCQGRILAVRWRRVA
jgi:hypothetical protein